MGCRKITYGQGKEATPFLGVWKRGSLAKKESELKNRDSYYPFGLGIAALSSTAPLSKPNNFKYNGKELQPDFNMNWYDYGARMFDPAIARWNGVDASAENYVNQSPYHYAGNNPIKFVDFDGNDYGIKVDRGNKTITIKAHYLTSSKSASAFERKGSGRWNAQSGKNMFITGSIRDLKRGKADAYKVNIELTSEVRGGEDGQGRYQSDRDRVVNKDKSGTLNSFDVETEGFVKNQNGGAANNQIDMLEGNENSSITTHEVNHTLGIAHTSEGGTQSINGGGTVGTIQVAETLAGVGIGGNNVERNQSSSVGDGRLLGNSTNQGLENGKVISAKRYNRIMRRLERREERKNN